MAMPVIGVAVIVVVMPVAAIGVVPMTAINVTIAVIAPTIAMTDLSQEI
jgi:hypothetical protein